MTGKDVLQILVLGLAGASIHYWILTTNPKNRGKEEFKWWLRTILPQAIVIAAACKMFRWY